MFEQREMTNYRENLHLVPVCLNKVFSQSLNLQLNKLQKSALIAKNNQM
jgi:hypothetical protein